MKTKIRWRTSLRVNETTEGEYIEKRLERMRENKEPISANRALYYTDKKDGVLPGYDIRTDRFEVARIAMEKIGVAERAEWAKREELPEVERKENVSTD